MAEDTPTLECPFCHNILRMRKGHDPLKAHAEHCLMWPDSQEEVRKGLEGLGRERVSELVKNAAEEARTLLADIVVEIVDRMDNGDGRSPVARGAVVLCMYCNAQLGIIPAIVDGPTDAIVVALPVNALMGLTESMIQHVVKEHTPGLNPGLVDRGRAGEN